MNTTGARSARRHPRLGHAMRWVSAGGKIGSLRSRLTRRHDTTQTPTSTRSAEPAPTRHLATRSSHASDSGRRRSACAAQRRDRDEGESRSGGDQPATQRLRLIAASLGQVSVEDTVRERLAQVGDVLPMPCPVDADDDSLGQRHTAHRKGTRDRRRDPTPSPHDTPRLEGRGAVQLHTTPSVQTGSA